VVIARFLTDDLAPWPSDILFEGEGDSPGRLADLLTTALSHQTDTVMLEPNEADDLVTQLLPIALSDETLINPIREAVVSHDLDESMNAIEILSESAAISLVILAATTEVELKFGKRVRIVKKAMGDAALVKLIELIERLLRLKTP
jgi:hypothetical protein